MGKLDENLEQKFILHACIHSSSGDQNSLLVEKWVTSI